MVVLALADDPRHVGPPGPEVERLVTGQLRPLVDRLLALMPYRIDKYAVCPRGDAL